MSLFKISYYKDEFDELKEGYFLGKDFRELAWFYEPYDGFFNKFFIVKCECVAMAGLPRARANSLFLSSELRELLKEYFTPLLPQGHKE